MAEATAAAGSFIYREDAEEEGLQVQSLRDYVVAIPTMNAVHGQDTWGARHVSDEYADHSAWDVHTIIEILRKFFDASEGTSLPDLAEYNWRLDKVTIAAAAAAAAPAPPLPFPSPPFPAPPPTFPPPLPPMPAPPSSSCDKSCDWDYQSTAAGSAQAGLTRYLAVLLLLLCPVHLLHLLLFCLFPP